MFGVEFERTGFGYPPINRSGDITIRARHADTMVQVL